MASMAKTKTWKPAQRASVPVTWPCLRPRQPAWGCTSKSSHENPRPRGSLRSIGAGRWRGSDDPIPSAAFSLVLGGERGAELFADRAERLLDLSPRSELACVHLLFELDQGFAAEPDALAGGVDLQDHHLDVAADRQDLL